MSDEKVSVGTVTARVYDRNGENLGTCVVRRDTRFITTDGKRFFERARDDRYREVEVRIAHLLPARRDA